MIWPPSVLDCQFNYEILAGEKKIYRSFFYTFQEPEINDTRIIESEKKPIEECPECPIEDVLDMTLDSDNEDEVETIPQKIEPDEEKTDATLNGEIEILSQGMYYLPIILNDK